MSWLEFVSDGHAKAVFGLWQLYHGTQPERFQRPTVFRCREDRIEDCKRLRMERKISRTPVFLDVLHPPGLGNCQDMQTLQGPG